MHNKAIVRILKAAFVPHSAFETAHRCRYVQTMNMKDPTTTTIRQISEKEIPRSILLQADPSEKCIDKYLPNSKCFGAFFENALVGVCVTNLNETGVWEIFNIVVIPEKQKQGIGTKLLKFIIRYFENIGEKNLELGTGTFGYQLLFYQRIGFRVEGVWKNFFVDNYSDSIYEQGVQLQDMLRLNLKLNQICT